MAKLSNREKKSVKAGLRFILNSAENRAHFSEPQLDDLKIAADKYGMKERPPEPKKVQLYEILGRKLDLAPEYIDQLKELLENAGRNK